LLIAKLLVRASKKNLETTVPPPLLHEISLVLSLHPPASRRFPLGTCPGDFTPAAPPDWSALSRMATAPGTSAPRTNANCSMNGSSKKGAPPSVPSTASYGLRPRRPRARCRPFQPRRPSRCQEGGSRFVHLRHHHQMFRCGPTEPCFAAIGQIIETGWRMQAITFNQLLKGLCARKNVDDNDPRNARDGLHARYISSDATFFLR
jgi:hypothetical protein